MLLTDTDVFPRDHPASSVLPAFPHQHFWWHQTHLPTTSYTLLRSWPGTRPSLGHYHTDTSDRSKPPWRAYRRCMYDSNSLRISAVSFTMRSTLAVPQTASSNWLISSRVHSSGRVTLKSKLVFLIFFFFFFLLFSALRRLFLGIFAPFLFDLFNHLCRTQVDDAVNILLYIHSDRVVRVRGTLNG